MKDLTDEENDKIDGDSLLLLRQLAIYHLARAHYPQAALLLEHPADPAKYCKDVPTAPQCSSIWATSLIPHYQALHDAQTATWPQCATGMDTQKWTTVLFKNLPHLK